MKSNKKYIKAGVLSILFFALILSGCSKKEDRNINQDVIGENVNISNPASVFCIDQGGELEIVNKDDGQQAICSLPNGLKCEEWDFFRGDCPATDSGKVSQPVSGDEQIRIIGIKADDSISSPVLIKGETGLETEKLIVELRNSNHDALVKEELNVKQGDGQKVFTINLHYVFANTKEGFIAVYQEGEVDEKISLVEIPVKFE